MTDHPLGVDTRGGAATRKESEREKLSAAREKKDGDNKVRLFKLYLILMKYTDDDHRLTRENLEKLLLQEGITPSERRTFSSDIAILRTNGVEIRQAGSPRRYWIPNHMRRFSEVELRTLIDAVQAARFIDRGNTDYLTSRLSELVSESSGKAMRNNRVHFNTNKCLRDDVFSLLDTINSAITNRHLLEFCYIDYNEKGEKVKRKRSHGSLTYVEEPLALVYREDTYYMLAYDKGLLTDAGLKQIYRPRMYRVDRMDEVVEQDKPISVECAAWLDTNKERIGEIVRPMVHMFGSNKLITMTLAYKKGDFAMVNALFDRFGPQGVRFSADNANYPGVSLANVNVYPSPPFWSWVAQFQGRLRIFDDRMRRAYQQYLQDNIDAAIDIKSLASDSQ